jgi:hypothetical protein
MPTKRRSGVASFPTRGRRASASAVAALLLGALLAAGGRADAAGLSDIPGAFVDVGIGVAEMGMGGAAVATSRGASSLFWNPAGLARSPGGRDVAVTYSNQMGLVPYSAASGSFRIAPHTTLGAGVVHSGDDVFSETTALVALARTIPLSWMRSGTLDAGATLRLRRAAFGGSGPDDVSGSAIGAAVDIGASAPITHELRVAIVARDLVNVLRWDTSVRGSYTEDVPTALVAGVAAEPRSGLVIEADLDKALRADDQDLLALGVELAIFDVASLRGGYRRAFPHDTFEEFTVGAGATVRAGGSDVTIDVAYLFGRLDDTLRLGAVFSF